MIAVWVAFAGVLTNDIVTVRDYLAVAERIGDRPEVAVNVPRHAAHLPGLDTDVWVRYAQTLLEGAGPQLRHTDIDNAPFGREVHWNSAWTWTIAGAGVLTHVVTGASITTGLERATLWLSPVALWVLIVVISGYAARRAGALAGVCVAIGMVGHDYFISGFLPSQVDHHGLLAASVLGMVLGAVFAGAGWIREEPGSALLPDSSREAHRAAAISAISGALGMWVSAASLVVPIAIVGVAGAVAAIVCAGKAARAGLRYDPRVWRTWGRVGGIACAAFYLVEYFPAHLGLRLEVNHPVYALAWWGGGEFIAVLTERMMREKEQRWARPLPLIAPLGLVLVAPLTILVGGARVFALLDPFMKQVHRTYISEFQPLWTTDLGSLWNPYMSAIGPENAALVLGLVVLGVRRRNAPPMLWFATVITAGLTAMAWLQNRWLANASGAQMVLALVLAAWLLERASTRRRWLAATAVFAALFAPGVVRRVVQLRSDTRDQEVAPDIQATMLERDIAGAIRASQPSGNIVLLASPDESNAVGYYGDFRTIGTLYWENGDGLKAAAAIFSAASAEEAAAKVRERGITHIALVTGSDFLAAYYALAHPGAADSDFTRSFGYQLLYGHMVPRWLQVVPYCPPDDLRGLNVGVVLFKVDFNQTADDALQHVAENEVLNGEFADAVNALDTLVGHRPADPQLHLMKARASFALGDWKDALDDGLEGIARSPVAERPHLGQWVGSWFMSAHREADAVRVYRAAVAASFDPELACSLAFVLSTSQDDRVRSGTEALVLAKRAAATKPDSPTYLLCEATALAESRQFADAARVATLAAQRAAALHDENAARAGAQMADAFRAGRAWRR